jgi:hypothetical protein
MPQYPAPVLFASPPCAIAAANWNDQHISHLQRGDRTKTTILAKNFPTCFTRNNVISLLDSNGFRGAYDFVYLPVSFDCMEKNFGYAFINFVAHEQALRFGDFFNGLKSSDNTNSAGLAEWSGAVQGFDENVKRYRDSPIMHDSMPEEVKPVIFRDGQPIAFPPPTKIIKMPRKKRCSRKIPGDCEGAR